MNRNTYKALREGDIPMIEHNAHAAKYRVRNENGSYVFTFLCASSGAAVCTAKTCPKPMSA